MFYYKYQLNGLKNLFLNPKAENNQKISVEISLP